MLILRKEGLTRKGFSQLSEIFRHCFGGESDSVGEDVSYKSKGHWFKPHSVLNWTS